MRDLNEKHVYDLSELASEEKQQLLEKLRELDDSWAGRAAGLQLFSSKYLYYTIGGWFVSDEIYYTGQEIVDAKELFYTLENIQVDCTNLTEEQINEMADVFEKDGYEIGSLYLAKEYCFIRKNSGKYCAVAKKDKNKTKITYEKFMELFSNKEENFKKLVEVLNEELTEESFKEITNSIADLLIYKNQKYGNSALNPLDIFNGKSKVGQRIDDKLARVKNSKELRKNDIADLLGYLTLVCQDNGWTNFDEFKD